MGLKGDLPFHSCVARLFTILSTVRYNGTLKSYLQKPFVHYAIHYM